MPRIPQLASMAIALVPGQFNLMQVDAFLTREWELPRTAPSAIRDVQHLQARSLPVWFGWSSRETRQRYVLSLGWFATKIFHPNVSSAGEICCLLIYPNPESALNEEAGKLLLENYNSYCSRARLITSVHATPAVRPPEFDTPSKSDSATPSTSKLTKARPHPQPSVESIATPTLAISSTTSSKNSASTAQSQSTQPLKATTSTLPTTTSNGSLASDGGKQKDRHPSPFGTTDANIFGKAPTNAATKAVKRTAKDTARANRKKALKRL